ncbi:hypothetical protein BDV59DRAFT_197933 [Aspergillus ambiguus]|uniref:uncharacterized protein n=1 Tax=Aspergillus ambiguus TaxID=176160 RepID=UPI003CCCF23C
MDQQPPRQWDPVAPSLLWAHQLRREHVHLADQLDLARTDLSATATIIKDLAEKMDNVIRASRETVTCCKEVNQHCTEQMDELHGCVRGFFDRFDALQAENMQLKNRVDLLEKECAARALESAEQIRILQTTVPLPERSDVLVPDSMPVDESALEPSRMASPHCLSGSTRGSSSQPQLVSWGRVPIPRGERIARLVPPILQQNGMSLVGYLNLAEDMGGAEVWEEDMLESFICGLDDSSTRRLVRSRVGHLGWSWSCLRAVVGELSVGEAVARKHGRTEDDMDRQKGKKRQRRSIPIVPADEADLIALGTGR